MVPIVIRAPAPVSRERGGLAPRSQVPRAAWKRVDAVRSGVGGQLDEPVRRRPRPPSGQPGFVFVRSIDWELRPPADAPDFGDLRVGESKRPAGSRPMPIHARRTRAMREDLAEPPTRGRDRRNSRKAEPCESARNDRRVGRRSRDGGTTRKRPPELPVFERRGVLGSRRRSNSVSLAAQRPARAAETTPVETVDSKPRIADRTLELTDPRDKKPSTGITAHRSEPSVSRRGGFDAVNSRSSRRIHRRRTLRLPRSRPPSRVLGP